MINSKAYHERVEYPQISTPKQEEPSQSSSSFLSSIFGSKQQTQKELTKPYKPVEQMSSVDLQTYINQNKGNFDTVDERYGNLKQLQRQKQQEEEHQKWKQNSYSNIWNSDKGLGQKLKDTIEHTIQAPEELGFTHKVAESARDAMTGGVYKPDSRGVETSNEAFNKVSNFGANMLGMGLGFKAPQGIGESLGSIMEKGISKPLENSILRRASAESVKDLPRLKQYGLNALKGGTEFGLLNGSEAYVNNEDNKEILKSMGEGALNGALFNTGSKLLGDYGLPALKKGGSYLKDKAIKTNTYESTMPLNKINKLYDGNTPYIEGITPKIEPPKVETPNIELPTPKNTIQNPSNKLTPHINNEANETDIIKKIFNTPLDKYQPNIIKNTGSISARGQGKRVKGQVLGGMSGAAGTTEKIDYDSVLSQIPEFNSNPKQLDILQTEGLFGGTGMDKKKMYLSAREYGLNHEQALKYTIAVDKMIADELPREKVLEILKGAGVKQDITQPLKIQPIEPAESHTLKRGETVNLNELANNQNNRIKTNLQQFTYEAPEAPPSGDFDTRSFVDNVKNSDITAPGVKDNLKSMPYEIKHNQDVYNFAKEYVDKDFNKALSYVNSNVKPTAEYNAIAQELMRRLQSEGRHDEVINIVERVAEKATKQGQAIQALSMWGRLTPEGILKYTQKQFNKANEKLPVNKKIKLKPEFAEDIATRMKGINEMPEGYEKTVETAKVMRDINEQIPVSIWRKISTVQAMAQLLNPKTINRNIVGNTIFGGLENTSNVIGTPLDMALSKITGKRTTTLPNPISQMKDTVSGFNQAAKEALEGINTQGDRGKAELDFGRTFKRNTPLGKLETGMDVALQATDTGFKKAAYNESLKQQMKLTGVTEPTDGMKEIAHKLAEYRTFQDDNGISKGFTNIKKSLNKVSSYFTGTDEWGLGDLVLKYAKTPANIVARALDYSPVGLFNTIKSLPVNGKSFNQKEFVDSLSRVTTGTGLIAAGYGLSKLGIITGTEDKDKDVARYNQQRGQSPYSINLNALFRYKQSGNSKDAKAQKGDKFVTWDWAAPASVVLGMGANIGSNKGSAVDLITTMADAAATGMDTLFEQPVLTGTQTLTRYGNMTEGLKNTLFGIPSSFTPTLGKQIAQLGDNTARSSYDPSKGQQALNQSKAKLPGLFSKLEPQITTFGDNRQMYNTKGLKRAYDVLMNPAFENTYNPKNQQVEDLYKLTGEKVHYPRIAKKSFEDGKEKIPLQPHEYTDYQRKLAQATQEIYDRNLKQNGDNFVYEKHAKSVSKQNKEKYKVVKMGDKDYIVYITDPNDIVNAISTDVTNRNKELKSYYLSRKGKK